MRNALLSVIMLWLLAGIPACAAEGRFTLPSGAVAYYLVPDQQTNTQPFKVIIALHGLGEGAEDAFHLWSPVAESMGYVLLVPQGTGAKNSYVHDVDKNIRNVFFFLKELKKKVPVAEYGNIVAGFSMGGSFALDLGLRHSRRFTTVISVFGFYEDRHRFWVQNQTREYLANQRYYLITGAQDLTRPNQEKAGHDLLRRGADVTLRIYPGLIHMFPGDFFNSIGQIAGLGNEG